MDRTIPHIRNIFSNAPSRKKSGSDTQDLCQYDKSPRSRRKPKDPPVDYYEYERLDKPTKPSSASSKKGIFDLGKENQHLKTKDKTKDKSSRNYNTYTSKTLTERDMKHLERHLSMKKTIRKQISRNLAQAFLDNPDIFEPDDSRNEHRSDHQIPSSSEQNVLDLLKISVEDRDSGHSSPTPEDTEDEADIRGWRSGKHRGSETRGLVDDRNKYQETEKKSTSIWKIFRSKDKR